MLPLRAIPVPLAIYALVLSCAAAALGLAMVVGGNLPRRLPSGLVDADGKRAILSPATYRLLGIGLLILGAALLLILITRSAAGVFVGFLLGAIAVIELLGAAALAWWERRARSLRQTRSSRAWTVVAFSVTMAVNWGLWMLAYGAHGE